MCLPTSYWDQSLLSSLNSLLDPAWMKDFLIAALHGGDFSTNLFVEMLNKKPSGGYWYAFNTISVFWMLEGYLAVTDDQTFLYDSLYNQSFAHLFLLAAFRSKLSEYSCNLRLPRSLNHFR
eukprot:COSAG04_NODE_692_length_11095_cov_3.236541_4_plen_121_part_00